MILIFEGPDNSGKGTLISNIKTYYKNISFHTLHYSNIKGFTSDESIKYGKKLYFEMFKIIEFCANQNISLICDRSHIGEVVYGPIYRNYDGNYIFDIENEFKNKYIWRNINLITLYDSPENLIKRDDGLSFSIEINKKQQEIDNFVKAHYNSNIENKLLINISENDEFNTLRKTINFLNK